MRTQTIALTYADGMLGVMTLILSDGHGIERELTPELVEAEVARSPKSVASWRRIDAADLPTDRAYRGAWVDTGERIDHDLPKARELHRERLRALRAPVLAALDVEVVRALEQGRPATGVAARKQALRDVTADPRIDAAQTVDELRAVGLPK